MTPTWVVPTVRAIPWQPLVGVGALLAGITAAAARAQAWPVGLLGIAAAGTAAAVVAGLRDPATALLSAVPTSAARRRARREALLLPVGLVLWLAYVGTGHAREPGLGWPIGEVIALVSVGLVVAVWAPAHQAVSAGVAAPLLWAAATWAGGSLDKTYAEVLFAWQHHPWVVAAVAVTALILGRNR